MTHKYFLVQNAKTWTDAQTYCQATYTDLAVVKTNDDMVRLQNEAQSQAFSSSAWIGMYNDVNAWHWSLGYEPVGSMRKWDVGEPNNNGGRQNCVVITPWGWWDWGCTNIHPFVCFDGKLYIYFTFLL